MVSLKSGSESPEPVRFPELDQFPLGAVQLVGVPPDHPHVSVDLSPDTIGLVTESVGVGARGGRGVVEHSRK